MLFYLPTGYSVQIFEESALNTHEKLTRLLQNPVVAGSTRWKVDIFLNYHFFTELELRPFTLRWRPGPGQK